MIRAMYSPATPDDDEVHGRGERDRGDRPVALAAEGVEVHGEPVEPEPGGDGEDDEAPGDDAGAGEALGAPQGGGRHRDGLSRAGSSIAAASSRSRSVTVPPAECVDRAMSTVFHEFDQSGWWPLASASSATLVMKANASEKSANWKRRRSAPSRSTHASSEGMRSTYVGGRIPPSADASSVRSAFVGGVRHSFVSYSHVDAEIVGRLERDLEGLGWTAWCDRELSGGQRWWDGILDNIRQCDVFVFAMSTSSLRSAACQRELEYAGALGKPVLPVLVGEPVPDGLLPPVLSETQRVDVRAGDAAAAIALGRALMQVPPAPPLPDPLPEPPAVPDHLSRRPEGTRRAAVAGAGGAVAAADRAGGTTHPP